MALLISSWQWLRRKIFRLRYLIAAGVRVRVPWVDFDELASSPGSSDEVVVISSGYLRLRRRLAAQLAAALIDSDMDFACGPVYEDGIPSRVVAAGFEAGHDGDAPKLIPLLEGQPLRRSWARGSSEAGRPSGQVFAVRSSPLMGLFDGEIPDRRSVINRLRREGPWLVVWSAAHRSTESPVSVDDLDSLHQRREQGERETAEYVPPTPSDPGRPAPPPAAIWVGPTPAKFEPGVDLTRLAPRVAVRHAAPDWSVAPAWGDHHFASSLADAFARRSIGCRIAPCHGWHHPYTARRLVITLRGLVPARPVAGRFNVLWVISHPETLTADEMAGYDLVGVASRHDVSRVASMTEAPTVELLQATSEMWRRGPTESDGSVVFVGNSRGVKRRAPVWAADAGLRPVVYGQGWEGVFDESVDLREPIPPSGAAEVFSRAGVVLADHWDDMRRLGYVSNRVFDVAAAGGVVVSDSVSGIEDLIPGVHTYGSAEELRELVIRLLGRGDSARQSEVRQLQKLVLSRHTFDDRVDQLLDAIRTHVGRGDTLVDFLADPDGERRLGREGNRV